MEYVRIIPVIRRVSCLTSLVGHAPQFVEIAEDKVQTLEAQDNQPDVDSQGFYSIGSFYR